ncbi:MAG TPA: hypothetical protein VFE23_01510 [Usitatibacter sp.]|jgi:hypothetical protein|nr:hypothetical protein [Usitatibacter sp.]
MSIVHRGPSFASLLRLVTGLFGGGASARPARPALSSTRPRRDFSPPLDERALEAKASAAPAMEPGAERAKNRDRYLALRFPHAVTRAEQLRSTERVLGAARNYFDQAKHDRCMELLDVAIGECPSSLPYLLARIEYAYLMNNEEALRQAVSGVRSLDPPPDTWRRVVDLAGRMLDELRVAGHARGEAQDAPWPDMPNWIGVSMDLTGDAHAIEFHRDVRNALGGEAPR